MMISPDSTRKQRLCSERVQVWRGKSGRRYVHTVYPTETCPDVGNAIYLAVGRDRSGTRRPLAIDGKQAFGAAVAAESLTAARRQLTWADEVHVHLLAQCDEQASRVMDDLCAEYDLARN